MVSGGAHPESMRWSAMSMRPRPSHAVPAMTAQVARAAFPKGCLAIRIRDALGELFDDGQFVGLFAVRGRPALSPARLALVLVLQFAEGLSDRQAADAVRGRIDWKYALGLELADTGFDASVLSEFRATLEALAAAVPSWLITLAPDGWYERYGQRARDWRLPKAEAFWAALAVTVGADGFTLLEAVHDPDAPAWLWQVPAVQTLRMVWVQQYYRDQDGLRWRGKGELPPGALAIGSPYDTHARYGIKRGVGWLGNNAPFTETCEPDRPHLIVHVATTVATANDVDTVAGRHADLAKGDLLPDQHLVDAGYVSVDHLLDRK